MPCDIKALRNQKKNRHTQAAKDFEVHPDFMKGKGNKQVGGSGEDEKRYPGHIKFAPDRLWQL